MLTCFLGTEITNLDKKNDFIDFYERKIKPCNDCKACIDNNFCVIKDDMQFVYDKLEISEIIIFASPVYNSSFPTPMKAAIDRCQKFFFNKLKDKKYRKAYLVLTCGSDDELGAYAIERQIIYLCNLLSINYKGMVLLKNTDRKGCNNLINTI